MDAEDDIVVDALCWEDVFEGLGVSWMLYAEGMFGRMWKRIWEDVWKNMRDYAVEDVVCSLVASEDAWENVNGGKGIRTWRWA